MLLGSVTLYIVNIRNVKGQINHKLLGLLWVPRTPGRFLTEEIVSSLLFASYDDRGTEFLQLLPVQFRNEKLLGICLFQI